jgi:hypothetical protein
MKFTSLEIVLVVMGLCGEKGVRRIYCAQPMWMAWCERLSHNSASEKLQTSGNGPRSSLANGMIGCAFTTSLMLM